MVHLLSPLSSYDASRFSSGTAKDALVAAAGTTGFLEDAEVEGGPIMLTADPSLSVLDGTPGVSIAASVDPDGNRQLYDLSSTGVIRLRKSAGNTTTWGDPEIVPANPAPKANTPMAALAWKGPNGSSVS